jgi:hypothetical protein
MDARVKPAHDEKKCVNLTGIALLVA